jgi:hypothetical protein
MDSAERLARPGEEQKQLLVVETVERRGGRQLGVHGGGDVGGQGRERRP